MQARLFSIFRLSWPLFARGIFWVGFYGVILISWVLLIKMNASPLPGMTAAEYWAALCVSAGSSNPSLIFSMWALMSAAMMLPTFVPAARVFGDLGSMDATSAGSMTALALGYLSAWLIFASAATTLQILLARAGALSDAGQLLNPWITAILLGISGGYQFSASKMACLSKCRHPLLFFMEYWKPGYWPAFSMGVRLGLWCIGCCWLLMLIGFIGGAMNVLWMGAATIFMVFEKLPEFGRFVTKPLGVILIGAALIKFVILMTVGGQL
jgi:predicted metal-binding membrane protein